MPDTRSAARALVRRGLKVFRVRSGTKDHFIDTDWASGAATDDFAETFDRWAATPDANPCVSASGLAIIDVDDKHGLEGSKQIAELFPGLPETFTVRTPSGGRHLYFRCADGEAFGQAPLAPGVDVRATNGYVLGPGSYTREIPGKQAEGFYEIERDAEIAPLPDALRLALRQAAQRATRPGAVMGEADTPAAIEAARRYLQTAPRASRGSRGSTTLKVAMRLGDLGISRDKCAELLAPWNETHCEPPQDEGEFLFSIRNAYRYRRAPIGNDNAADQFAAAPIDPADLEPETPEPTALERFAARVQRFNVLSKSDAAALPRVPWLVPNRLLLGSVSGLISPPGIGKSSIALQWAAALATLQPGMGLDVSRIDAPISSLIYNAEDPIEIMRHRLTGVCDRFGLDYAAVHDRVHLWSGLSNDPFTTVRKRRYRGGEVLEPTEDLEASAEYAKLHGIKFRVFDPLAEIHEGEENGNTDMRRVMACLRKSAADAGSADLVIHHTKKPPQASGEAYAGDANSARGATAIIASLRVALTLFTMSDKDAELYEVAPAERRKHIRLDDAKMSWGEMSERAEWFKRSSLTIPNGDSVGVLAPVHLRTSAENAAPTIAAELAKRLVIDKPEPLGTAVGWIIDAKVFGDLGKTGVRSRIFDAFGAGLSLSVDGMRIELRPAGQGGTVVMVRETVG